MGNDDQIQGKLEQTEGKVKEGVGSAVGDRGMENQGRMDQAKGDVREGVGNVKEGVDKATQDWNKDNNR